jgi:hypothetical protein
MSANPFTAVNHERHTLRRHVLRIRNLERRPGGQGSRRIFGQVSSSSTGGPDSDGILEAGSADWTVAGEDDGNWAITFDPPFASAPTVVASENGDTTDPPSFVQVTSIAEDGTGCTVTTYDKTGDVSNDRGFNFIALGS